MLPIRLLTTEGSSSEDDSTRGRASERVQNYDESVNELRGSKGQAQSLIVEVSGTNSSSETSPPKRAPRSIDKPKTASNQFNELNTTITSTETLFQDISPTSVNVSTVRDNEANAAYDKNCELNKEVKECVPIVASSRNDVKLRSYNGDGSVEQFLAQFHVTAALTEWGRKQEKGGKQSEAISVKAVTESGDGKIGDKLDGLAKSMEALAATLGSRLE